MDITKELIILFFRVITILPLMLFVTLLMGKRSIAELPVFDFLIVITLGAVVGADLADPAIKHIHTAVAVVLIGLFQISVAKGKIINRTFGRLITFEPTIVIHNGVFLVNNLRRIRYSIDNILQMLRENDVFDVSDVELGIVEANGQLTIHKTASKSTVTLGDLGLDKSSTDLSFPVVIDGKIYKDVLETLDLDEEWLRQKLTGVGVSDMTTVFFASLTKQKELHVSLKDNQLQLQKNLPPIFH
ncbi:DUF421 domain-containing protein [Halalkalibacter alkalisediminis]|uniref:DUF421 domain-containing protein n=1 Tax=Halalkalibacter alkalisediminis TaxID=935616 RepID=UPI003B5C1988